MPNSHCTPLLTNHKVLSLSLSRKHKLVACGCCGYHLYSIALLSPPYQLLFLLLHREFSFLFITILSAVNFEGHSFLFTFSLKKVFSGLFHTCGFVTSHESSLSCLCHGPSLKIVKFYSQLFLNQPLCFTTSFHLKRSSRLRRLWVLGFFKL